MQVSAEEAYFLVSSLNRNDSKGFLGLREQRLIKPNNGLAAFRWPSGSSPRM